MRKKILLAEDDSFIRLAYKQGLEGMDFDVLIAVNGADAANITKKEKPDLILLDILMPIKNGFEAAEEIKKEPELANIPIIILSNMGQDADVERGKKIGISEYLIKSNLTMREVIEKIRKYLE